MADTFLSPQQLNPPAGVLSTLYTATASTVISTFTVCNTGGSPATFSMSIAVNGAADTLSQYIYSGVSIPAKTTFAATLGISIKTDDVVKVSASSPLLAFNLFGVQVA